MTMLAWLCPEMMPPPSTTIPIEAPNAEALDTPRVYGDPRGFFSTHCMTAPAIPSAKPARTQDVIRGSPRSHTRMLSTRLTEGSSLWNKMKKSSE